MNYLLVWQSRTADPIKHCDVFNGRNRADSGQVLALHSVHNLINSVGGRVPIAEAADKQSKSEGPLPASCRISVPDHVAVETLISQ